MNADGGTPQSKAMTRVIPRGLPATRMLRGSIARLAKGGKSATAPGSGKSALNLSIEAISAPMNADGGTPRRKTKTGLTTIGSAAKSSTRGGIARLRLVIAATATGSGRSALNPSIKTTTAPMNADGGTPRRMTKTGLTTIGSAATSSIRGGGIAGETTASGLLEQ